MIRTLSSLPTGQDRRRLPLLRILPMLLMTAAVSSVGFAMSGYFDDVLIGTVFGSTMLAITLPFAARSGGAFADVRS